MQILYNAKIHTLNSQLPNADALAIDDHAPQAGRILAVGNFDNIKAEFGIRAQLQDMEGRVILPGLTDAHIHLRGYAEFLQYIQLSGLSKEECLAAVAERAKETPPGEWIRGHGWNQNNWEDGQFPRKGELDAAAPDHPVLLTATSLHASWANQAALKAAGVNAGTPDPEGGAFQRDEQGNPTGIIFEHAMRIVSQAVPRPTGEETAAVISAAQTSLWQMGLTGVHDFDRHSFSALQRLRARGELKLRVLKHLPVENLDAILTAELRSGFGDDMLRIGGIKVFADGALGPHTAAMLQPYENEPDNRGMPFLDGEEFFEHASRAALGGLSMTVHAIGDAANHEMLKGYAQLRRFEKAEKLPHRRHRIEHAQILHPADFEKFKELEIIASVQPIHATSDMDMADAYWGERSRYSYAWRSLLEQGIPLAFGSDAPVDSPNPFWGIHAAVTRQRAGGYPGPEGWYPEQKLSLQEAMHGYTHGAATAACMEDRLGRLAPGYLADLIVLTDDPFDTPPEDLREISPRAVMVGGDWVWQG